MHSNESSTDLPTIAARYDEHVHLIALADNAINSVADLAGRRVFLDELGSGAYVDSLLILEVNCIHLDDLTP